jgi:hypothetical protein
MRHLRKTLSVVVLSLAACGGGGGGTPEGTLALTTQNSDAVLAAVLGSGGDIDTIGEALFDTLDGLDLTRDGTFACPMGGTYTVTTISKSPPSQTLDLDDCAVDFLGDGVNVLNGQIKYSVLSLGTVRLVFDLTGQSGMNMNRAFGDMTMSERLGSGSNLVMTAKGATLGLTENGFGATLEKYQFVLTTDLGTGEWTQTGHSYVRSTALAGTVYAETQQPLAGPPDEHPQTGVLMLRGANGSRIRVTLQIEDILVELDADGDGVYESSEIITWDDLD